MSVSSAFTIGGAVGKLPIILLVSLILESLAYGVSGFLMSLVVIFVSGRKDIKPVICAAVIVAVLPIAVKTEFISSSQPQFLKIYLLSNIIIDVIFLFGFAVFGAWLLTRSNRLKIQKVKKDVQ